jgi:hypothetical protein
MQTLKLFMIVLAFIPLQVHAGNERNLAVSLVSEKRIALVIGNSAYASSPLKNPVNDAKDIAAKLRKLGFAVIERNNLKTKQIGRTLSEFRSKLVPGGVALVFYAGHGIQIKGENYLPAVDAEIATEEDVQNQSLAVKQILDVLDESRTRLNLIFLDACRNNPYAHNFRSAAGEGLARISAPSGTLISYATRPGSVAQDGDGRNGLYTSKLLAQMDSNQQIEQDLKQVVTAVKAASQGKQEPWMEGSIEGDFCFAGCVPAGRVPVANMTPTTSTHIKSDEEIEQESWNSARDSGNVSSIKEYLNQYPKGRFAGEAEILLATLNAPPPKELQTNSQAIEKALADLRAKQNSTFCKNAEYAIIHARTACWVDKITFVQIANKSKITDKQKAILPEYIAAATSFNKEFNKIFRTNGGAAGGKFADLREKMIDAKFEKNYLDLYSGEITWGEFNQRMKDALRSFRAEANKLRHKQKWIKP